MKRIKKAVTILFTITLLIIPSISQAALQANGGTVKTDTIGNWLLNIRNMEAFGGTLGLTDTINSSNLSSSAETPNNLDIHMEKNTEYGAMAILSASAYGNQNKITDGQTTTGNKTGIYIKLNKEWVSAGTITNCTLFKNAKVKYKNAYTTKYSSRKGDAITETKGWHGSTSSIWLDRAETSGLIRAYGGSIFSYWGEDSTISYGDHFANYSQKWATRAVIVVGQGF